MSPSPPQVPNDHENDSETKYWREREKKCGRREDFDPLLQAVTHPACVAPRPEREKDIKRNTGKSDRQEELQAHQLKVNLKEVIC